MAAVGDGDGVEANVIQLTEAEESRAPGGTTFDDLTDGDHEARMKRLSALFPNQPTCEVRFKDLTYTVQRAPGSTDEPTVGDAWKAGLKTLLCVPCFDAFSGKSKVVQKTVINQASGIFKPGEITLLLGPPGCGKSSLLKALAGRLKHDRAHTVTGDILYNGQRADSRGFSLPKVAHYVEQIERHLPAMTVQETFDFAFDSMSGGTHMLLRPQEKAALTREQREEVEQADKRRAKVELILRALGLYNAKDTVVGDATLRGVSGGERRRVTAGEMLQGGNTVFLMDSISTGLDTSTTLDIVRTLRSMAHIMKRNVVISLLQPPPEVYNLFDKVALMMEGSIVYHGPRDSIVGHFNALGYTLPCRKDEADWLVEVVTETGSMYLTQECQKEHAPRAAEDFLARWRETDMCKAMDQELAGSDHSSPGYEWPFSQQGNFAGSWTYHFGLCLKKHYTLQKRDTEFVRGQIASSIVMGLVVGSIFWDLSLEDANAKFGLIFFSLLSLALGAMAQIPTGIAIRGVFYKQRDAGFYPTSCDVLAQTLVNSGLSAAQAVLFSPLVYFMVGFNTDDGGAPFWIFLVMIIGINLNFGQYFRFLSAIFPQFNYAQSAGGGSFVFLVLFCGFLVPETSIPDGWIWMFWANPMAWAFRALVLNEFLSSKYEQECVVVAADGSCQLHIGQAFLDAYGFRQDTYFIWGAIVFILAEFALVALVTGTALHLLRWDASDNAPIHAEEEEEAKHPMTSQVPEAPAAVSVSSPFVVTGDKEAEKEGEAKEAEDTAVVAAEEGTAGKAAFSLSSFNVPVEALKSQASDMQEDLPFEPVTLVFREMSYSVPHPAGEGELDLLKKITGYCQPGEMTALMGSSGAGKTTLLDVLAGRKTGGRVTGDILINGFPKDHETFTRVAGYVEQMDIHSPYVTVRQALMFSATMRLDDSVVTVDQRVNYVEDVMRMLELDVLAERLIGSDDTGGLSIEQRKRVTLGVELAANPSLIFLDEPTSGLDARAAQMVMRAVRKVAATGRTVICTIHQPSTYLFELFDALLLLKKGGETVFFGPLGAKSSELIAYLEAVPGTSPIMDNVNPATWMLEAIGAGTAGKVDPQSYAEYYKSSATKAKTDDAAKVLAEPPPGAQPLHFASKYAASTSLQLRTCIDRSVKQYWRNPTRILTREGMVVLIAVLFGSTLDAGTLGTESDVAAVMGLMYMASTFLGVMCYQGTIPFFSTERVVFYREVTANTYSVKAYAMGYGVAEIPWLLLDSTLFTAIFYFMVGLDSEGQRFAWFWWFFLLFITFMTYLGICFTALLPNMKVAQAMGGFANSIMSLVAGFLISPAKIPTYWLWAFWLNPMHYVLEGMVTTQFNGNDSPLATAGGTIVTVEQWVNDFFGGWYKYEHRWRDVAALLSFIVLARLGYLYAITYVRHIKR